MIVDGDQMTFGQWDSESNRLARSLTDAGVERGDAHDLHARRRSSLGG